MTSKTLQKIHDFVAGLLLRDYSLAPADEILEERYGDRINFARFVPLPERKIYPLLSEVMSLHYTVDSGEFGIVLYSIAIDGSQGKMNLPYGNFWFDFDGNLKTKGCYVTMASLRKRDRFLYDGIEFTVAAVCLENGSISFECTTVTGAITVFSPGDAVLLPEEGETP